MLRVRNQRTKLDLQASSDLVVKHYTGLECLVLAEAACGKETPLFCL